MESIVPGMLFGVPAFVICFFQTWFYFRKTDPNKATKYALVISAIYGILTFAISSTPSSRTPFGPDIGPTTGILMLFFAGVIHIPIHYLRKWYREGYEGKNRKANVLAP